MTDKKPWGDLDPNTQHQLWSEWVFMVYQGGRTVPYIEVRDSAHRWIKATFSSIGVMKVEERVITAKFPDGKRTLEKVFQITVHVEGIAAHDPQLVAYVRQQFLRNFVSRGWGSLATGDVKVRILAGDQQDGKPRSQVVVMPRIQLEREK